MAEVYYVQQFEIEDELLRNLITNSDLEAASQHIIKLARSLGVDPADIPDPAPMEVKELASAVACARRCKLSMGVGTRMDANGVDTFEVKRRIYLKEIQNMTIDMTAAMMKGSTDTNSYAYAESIELFRG